MGGCLFHLYRAFDTNIDQRDLRQLKKAKETFVHALRLLKALAFVPPDEVNPAYKVIVDYIDEHLEVR